MGVDLAEIGTPRLSWRRLRNLVARLPRTSQTWQDREGPAWSITDQLLDMHLFVTRMQATAERQRKKVKPFAPEHQPRPKPVTTRRLSVDELAAWKAGALPTA